MTIKIRSVWVVDTKAMFTLCRIVKRSVTESVPDRASVHTRNAAFEAVSAPEQYCSALLLKVELPYRIGLWNGPNQVWTLLSEQKLQRNLVLENNLFKSKCSVTNCVMDRASVHTRNAAFEAVSAPEQYCSALLLKVELPYRIGLWNGPNQVWTLLSEQKFATEPRCGK